MLGAGAFGWKFIFFSAVFFLFLGALFSLPGNMSGWIANNTIANNTFTAGSYNATATTTTADWDVVKYIFQNPFSSFAWLAWISVAMLITDIYIIVTSLIP